ncbi:MAG: cobalt-precorrin 5A hydrolase [Dethiobacter sp.]|jgi:cobalt-precorrin 5A hydrolase|nr:cobalt-precorrin 5A hydrolase [Dethiobacter sp.]
MNGAVIALTPQGRILALRIAAITGYTAYLPQKLVESDDEALPYASLREAVADNFTTRRALVLIMATGIAVRLLAPLLQNKLTDPAVVLLDEGGRHAISLLSGHWGGANELACLLAESLGAVPVITTATDVAGLKAVDVFAAEMGVVPEPFERVRDFNAAMLQGVTVAVFSDLPQLTEYSAAGLCFYPLSQFAELKGKITCRALLTHLACYPGSDGQDLYLRPPDLYLGLGCRRGITAAQVIKAIESVLARFNLAAGSLAGLASIDLKSDEQGLLQAAEYFKLPIRFFSGEEVRRLPLSYLESAFVYQTVGVKGVCEPTAMLAAGSDRLLVTKQKVDGVTVAIAQADYPWSGWGREINRP